MLAGVNPGDATTRPPPGQMIAEFARGLIVAYVLARFVVLLGVRDSSWRLFSA